MKNRIENSIYKGNCADRLNQNSKTLFISRQGKLKHNYRRFKAKTKRKHRRRRINLEFCRIPSSLPPIFTSPLESPSLLLNSDPLLLGSLFFLKTQIRASRNLLPHAFHICYSQESSPKIWLNFLAFCVFQANFAAAWSGCKISAAALSGCEIVQG